MIEFFIFVVAFIIGFVLGIRMGWSARERVAKKFVMDYLTRMNDQAEVNTVNIELSKEGDVFLVHNKETGEFLAQGLNHKEISKTLQDRFPTKTFVCAPEDLEKVGYSMSDV